MDSGYSNVFSVQEIIPQPCESPRKTDNTAAINIMIDEATQILNERVDISASSLRTYIKRLEVSYLHVLRFLFKTTSCEQ